MHHVKSIAWIKMKDGSELEVLWFLWRKILSGVFLLFFLWSLMCRSKRRTYNAGILVEDAEGT
jgi:hypothetical protein